MTYKLIRTASFERDVRLPKKQNRDLDKLAEVLELLRRGERFPAKYRDHKLKGRLTKFRELHIQPDWLLVYIKNKSELILTLSRTGTHAELLNI